MRRGALALRICAALSVAVSVASVGALAQAGAGSASSPPMAGSMQLGAPAPAPIGFLRFCARRPDQCGLDPTEAGADLETQLVGRYYWGVTFQAEPAAFDVGVARREPSAAMRAPLSLTGVEFANLADLNQRINHAIRYESDIKQFGVADYWTLPLDGAGRGAGDCKDYVLEKRRALTDAGVPLDDLSIAIVRTGLGETHAVLLVATDQGELVMDSLSPRIMRWSEVRYTWIERQAPGRQLAWVKVAPRQNP